MAFFGRFTERAQRSLIYAQEEARALGHNYVGTEHLLLGLLREDQGVAAQVLSQQGVNIDDVREEIEELLGKGDFKFDQSFGYTPRSKRIMELSFYEARNLGHNYVGTEHLLLALIREGEGVGIRILKDLGIDLQMLREQVINILREEGVESNNRSGRGKSNTPTLDQFGRDLTDAAREGKLDPVIGRDKEIQRVIQILSRRTKNNPVLIGEPGVGKTAIAEGLAQRIVEGNIPELLRDKRLVTLDLSGMVAGAKYRGEFEERLKTVMAEIKKANDIILFIDEMHTIIGAGAAEGAIDASNILKPALSRGEIQAIGATTIDEYRKYVEKDPALERRFQPVTVGEPSKEESVQILLGLRDKYEAHHKVRITDEAIEAAVNLSDRYITDRYLPDKAIDLIDEAASRVRLQAFTAPPKIKELEDRLENLKKEKEEAVMNQNYEKAAQMRDEEQQVREQIEQEKEKWKKKNGGNSETVGEEDIAHIVSSWTGIPVVRLTEDEAERLLNMEAILHSRVIGQEEAVKAVSRAIRRARAGLKDPHRPIGSFIFLGPTGVGKTELCKALAEALFGDEDAMVRIDMSEYMEKYSVSRLVGSPPGYVGYEEGGQLTEQIRRKPYSVILFDEVEKAHPDVFNILLQILEDGRLTDSQGRTVDFRNTVIVLTSNVGAHTMRKQTTLGFAVDDDRAQGEYERMKENVLEELKRTFRPEFLNRLDEIIVFHSLEQQHIRRIVDLMLKNVAKRLEEKDIHIEVTDAVKDYMAQEGFDPVYGARPLRRTIQRLLEDNIAEEILAGRIKVGDKVLVDVKEGKLTFNNAAKELLNS
ncbi:MAG: ATP-dependent Clp protease ATP-binding subunit [Xylanivirga thermophila]|jgi:ATP-dependent Clp protease ATP-binding subunit ClpC|uniref:ATP-dependent Clp protease ATP-binding subunit n=1 Tax=Xylanivirga thermophila TaxID=2496273 RepID=UPI00101B7D73|nr:ATP-dependent Clp protease ATP-binding subunit [Xylanivirga thermophila]